MSSEVLIQRREEMWRNCQHSRNLFKTSQATRLASIERSLDTTMLRPKHVLPCIGMVGGAHPDVLAVHNASPRVPPTLCAAAQI